jgi:hypothetical protein
MSCFSIQTITTLVQLATGGPGMGQRSGIGKYRTGTEIETLLGHCGIDLHKGAFQSRVPAVRSAIVRENEDENLKTLAKLVEAIADPREYPDNSKLHGEVLEILRENLAADGFELQQIGGKYRLREIGQTGTATVALAKKLDPLDYDSVSADFEKALSLAETDPSEAAKHACSLVESVCKCILDEMKQPYPTTEDITHLWKAVAKALNIYPDRTDIERDVKMTLSGLCSVVGGIGAIRTHDGAHGRGKNVKRIDNHIARLSIYAASTAALFLIETWQNKGGKESNGKE